MSKPCVRRLLPLVMVFAFVTLAVSAAQAAPQCVDPNTCPIIVCPPGWTFVDTTCKKCAHCEPPKGKKRPGEEPISNGVAEGEKAVSDEALETCVEQDAELLLDASMNAEAVGKKPRGCKPCSKDRRFCECTYNGVPRISCDPCCYQDETTPLPICLD